MNYGGVCSLWAGPFLQVPDHHSDFLDGKPVFAGIGFCGVFAKILKECLVEFIIIFSEQGLQLSQCFETESDIKGDDGLEKHFLLFNNFLYFSAVHIIIYSIY